MFNLTYCPVLSAITSPLPYLATGCNLKILLTAEFSQTILSLLYRSCVRIVSSNRSGMGKSLYILRLSEKLKKQRYVTIPLHGPVVTPDTVLELFKDHMMNPTCCIYHIDIGPNVCLLLYSYVIVLEKRGLIRKTLKAVKRL